MDAFRSTVVEDVVIVASGVLKCVCKDWHAVEGPVLIDAFGKCKNSGGEPRGVNHNEARRGPKEIPNQVNLLAHLLRSGRIVDFVIFAVGLSIRNSTRCR